MIDPPAITVFLHGTKVGRLATTPDGLCAFQYDAEYVASGHSISPLALPLTTDVAIARPTPFGGNFGVFDDSLPDGWGRLLQDRVLRERGVDPNELTALQRLALTGADGRGALEYQPAEPCNDDAPRHADLDALASAASRVLEAQAVTPHELAALAQATGSSGGARPKVFLRDDDGGWLVKFPASIDPPDVGRTEYECSLLAGRCGVQMPETRLFDDRYFGVRRFDRTAHGKVHVVSAAGLVDADYRIPSLDYQSLLALTRRLTRDMGQVEQMYRRMVFNVVIGNRDDHAKNFAYLMDDDGRWTLTPAYDLLPSPGFNGFHTTTVNGSGRPTDDDMLAVGVRAGLSRRVVVDALKEIRAVVLNRHPAKGRTPSVVLNRHPAKGGIP